MLRSCAIIITAALGVVSSASSQEKKIQRADLPAAVERTVSTQGVGATIRGFSMEKEKGHTYYEAEMTVAGHRRDVLIDEAGAVVEVEEEVALDALPPAVRDGLNAKAGNGKIRKVESLTKAGKLVGYEAQVVTAGKKSEIQVGPDGKPLDHEE
jgi:flagellar basal body rod protein FlgF